MEKRHKFATSETEGVFLAAVDSEDKTCCLCSPLSRITQLHDLLDSAMYKDGQAQQATLNDRNSDDLRPESSAAWEEQQ